MNHVNKISFKHTKEYGVVGLDYEKTYNVTIKFNPSI